MIQKRNRTERGQDGLYTYYRPSVVGVIALTEAADESILGEREFDDMEARRE